MSVNQENFLNLIKTEKVCVMLAPSFVIDFKYPAIIGMFKKLGVPMITELTFGAKMVNLAYADYIEKNINQKYFISSTCPLVVSFVKNQYKELVKYLVPVVSPMGAQARILNKTYFDYKIVFISPCRAKQNIEAKEYSDAIAEVITFKELKEIFDEKNIKEENFLNCKEKFDSIIDSNTKIYPVSGGLAKSSHLKNLIKEREIFVEDGTVNIKNVLEEIKNETTKYRFFDLLNCNGGCIGGPEINNKDISEEDKKSKILNYKKYMEEIIYCHNEHNEDVDGINFGKKFE